MKILLEDSWQADDICEWSKQKDYTLSVLTADELMAYDSSHFLDTAYFCSTDIVQHHLRMMNLINIVPDTYEVPTFSKQLGRTIESCKLGEVDFSKGPRFVKPVANKKEFDGRVLDNLDGFEAAYIPCPDLDIPVYHTAPFTLICEYRVLIGLTKVYAVGHMNKAKYTEGMLDFIESIRPLVSDSFKCIDIAMAIKPVARWIIVEINPPFSLDDYDIDLDSYMHFCIDACAWIRTNKGS